MSKDYKGYEILEKIDKGQILDGTILLFTSTISDNKIKGFVKKKSTGPKIYREHTLDILPVSWFLNSKIEIIEEEPEIDIQGIEELDNWFVDKSEGYREFDIEAINYCFKKHNEKINELLQAIKQLDKQIKEE